MSDRLSQNNLEIDFATPADGNCLFHAVLLSGTRAFLNAGLTHSDLRQNLFNFASDDDLYAAATENEMTPLEYRNMMTANGADTGVYEIALLSKMLHISIVSVTPFHVRTYTPTGEHNGWLPLAQVVIVYNGHNHYFATKSIADSTLPTASVYMPSCGHAEDVTCD
jgi:hypothetical protein